MLKSEVATVEKYKRGHLSSFIDRGIGRLAEAIKAIHIEPSARGLLGRLDARVKILFLICFIVLISLKQDIGSEAGILFFVLCLALASGIKFLPYAGHVLSLGVAFGFLLPLPAALNVFTRGEVLLPLVRLSRPYDFWIYHIPPVIGITREGMGAVTLLTLRVMGSVSISLLILYTTPFPEIIRALKLLRVPDAALFILSLAAKYTLIFLKTLGDMHLAMRSRLSGPIGRETAGGWIADRASVLFRKSLARSEKIHKSMEARGFRGEIVISKSGKLTRLDLLAAAFFLIIGSAFLLR